MSASTFTIQDKAPPEGVPADAQPMAAPRLTEDEQFADKMMSSWIAIEALSPAGNKSVQDVADSAPGRVALPLSANGKLAWEEDLPEGQKSAYTHFDVVLGHVPVDDVYARIISLYGSPIDDAVINGRGIALLASLRILPNGCLDKETPLVISSFGWAVGKALTKKLKNIGEWGQAENAIYAKYTSLPVVQYENPISVADLQEIYYFVLESCDLLGQFASKPAAKDDLIIRPSDVIGHLAAKDRTYIDRHGQQRVQKARQRTPDPIINNSFYMKSLVQAQRRLRWSTMPHLQRRYLGLEQPQNQLDILGDPKTLEDLIQASALPTGKWPNPGHAQLAPLQQAVVSLALVAGVNVDPESKCTTFQRNSNTPEADAMIYMASGEGQLIAVNGPPGTGKTTLAKDLVAGLVVERALRMTAFKHPRHAFSQTTRRGVYNVHKALHGFEVMVASANNAAVENISAEWPSKNAVHDDPALKHFAQTAANLYAQEDGPVGEHWGVVSAVLGSVDNRRKFRKAFWLDEDYGLRNWFRYIGGEQLLVPIPKTSPTKFRKPHMALENDAPDNIKVASERWAESVAAFKDLHARCEAAIVDEQAKQQFNLESMSHEERHTLNCTSNELNLLREEMFAAAMDVHRSFCNAAAEAVATNIQAFFDCLSGSGFIDADEAFRTFSFLVPLWSTTFASLPRMTANLSDGAIGWLIIDEAGQAAPQLAIAGMAVAKNAICVGDPLQVEPVVTLNENMLVEIANQFEVPLDNVIAPHASVQSFADHAGQFYAEIMGDTGPRRVGIPLLVHRRCSEPMFSISNKIAYGGLMIHAKGEKNSAIREVCGGSQWIDVRSSDTSKFNQEEWKVCAQLLTQIATLGRLPDLYIITPFRKIQNDLRYMVKTQGHTLGLSPHQAQHLIQRIGTVHKMQGREADSVIMVLGAQGGNNARARNWAGRSPNILNVAATRAKENFYVIGNREEWGDCGYFKVLDREIGQHEHPLFKFNVPAPSAVAPAAPPPASLTPPARFGGLPNIGIPKPMQRPANAAQAALPMFPTLARP